VLVELAVESHARFGLRCRDVDAHAVAEPLGRQLDHRSAREHGLVERFEYDALHASRAARKSNSSGAMHTSPHAGHDLDAHGLRRQVEHRDLAARTVRSALLRCRSLLTANTGTPAESLASAPRRATGAPRDRRIQAQLAQREQLDRNQARARADVVEHDHRRRLARRLDRQPPATGAQG